MRLLTVIILSAWLSYTGCAATNGPNLVLTSDSGSECTCPGQQLSYECTTVGPVATVWLGSAFQCENNNILLRHSQFTSLQGVSGTCNNGAIAGHSRRVEENCFTSQLNITVSSNMNGQTVQCAHNDGQTLSIIGTNEIAITTSIYIPSMTWLFSYTITSLSFIFRTLSTTKWYPANRCPSRASDIQLALSTC